MRRFFIRFPGFKLKALTFSFDDQRIEDRKLVEIMNRYKVKGTFNLNSGLFDDTRKIEPEEVKPLYIDNGHEIAVHGKYHIFPTAFPKNILIDEIAEDKKALEKMSGKIIRGSAYAFGCYNDDMVDTLKSCGIGYARTVTSTKSFNLPENWYNWQPTCHHFDGDLIELGNKFVEIKEGPFFWENEPKLFYVWGHSYEFTDTGDWNTIEKFLNIVANKEDTYYATNLEIYDYLKAADSLVYSSDNSMVYNHSAIDVYLKQEDKREFIVKAGQTVKIK